MDPKDIRTIGVMPESSVDRPPASAPTTQPLRYGKDGVITRDGMEAALKQNGSIKFSSKEDGKDYVYSREEDLPSQEQIGELMKRNAAYDEKLKKLQKV